MSATLPRSRPASVERHPSSFRDPSGYVFLHDGRLYRRVNAGYRPHYERMTSSGFAKTATDDGLLVAHDEVPPGEVPGTADAYRVLAPERVPFVSHPYEWSFAQLRDAALLTLELQKRALGHGLTLKDASAFNVQFLRGRPVFIDSLSFTIYEPGRPWVAYQQFCQHFLAPLALMAHSHVDLGRMLAIYLDGIPLDVASRLLPRRTWARPGLLTHVHAHARMVRRHASGQAARERAIDATGLSPSRLAGLVDHLESTVRGLDWRASGTEWAAYYADTNYSPEAFADKREAVTRVVTEVAPAIVWDLGANDGTFGRIATERRILTVAMDADPAAVQKSYLDARRRDDAFLLPLRIDLTNPSGDLGWGGEERASLAARGPADLALALALVHHLAIRHNVPFERQAAFFRRVARRLLIELPHSDDSQVERLLAARVTPVEGYDVAEFERAFGAWFVVEQRFTVAGTKRSLYLLRARA